MSFAIAEPYSFALNSLTSPGMVAATLAGLKKGGRMREISKRDIWSPQRIAQERPDIDYQLVAIDFLPVQVLTFSKQLHALYCIPLSLYGGMLNLEMLSDTVEKLSDTGVEDLLAERQQFKSNCHVHAAKFCLSHFNANIFLQTLNASFERVSAMLMHKQVKPLPAVVYDFSSIHEALRQFSAAKHIGKIVVKLPGTAEENPAADPSSSNKGAWIVTGGLGALGVLTAKWLAGQGKKTLHLLSRSGR